MRRLSHDFFSDPLWPYEHPSALEVNKSHSSEEMMKEDFREKEHLESATASNECIAHYIKIEELSNSFEMLSNHNDSITEEHNDQQSSAAESGREDTEDQLRNLSAQIQLSLTSQHSSFPLERRSNPHGCYQILSKQAKQFLVSEMSRTTIAYVSKKYGIATNNLCRWKKTCERRRGAGRKITDAKLEERLIKWIKEEQNKKNLTLTRKQIQENAKLWAEDRNFKASKGWFERFAKRNSELNLLNFFQFKAKPQKPSFGPLIKSEDIYEEEANISRLHCFSSPRSTRLRPIKGTWRSQ